MIDRRVAAPRELPDWLLARGRPWVTNDEMESLLGVSPHEASRVAGRWHAKSLAFSPARGLQMLIPPEFRSWAAVPAMHFVDPMMKHLGHGYYIGYLSAAEIHGAAHQRPQVFQVVTGGRMGNREFGRVRVEFFSSNALASRPTITVNTPTGTLIVSTVETTVLDLVAHPRRGGGTSNVATVIGELLQDKKIAPRKLAEASEHYPVSVALRTGWLIEHVANLIGVHINLAGLHKRVAAQHEPTPLIASEPRRGPVCARWNVYINGEIEADL